MPLGLLACCLSALLNGAVARRPSVRLAECRLPSADCRVAACAWRLAEWPTGRVRVAGPRPDSAAGARAWGASAAVGAGDVRRQSLVTVRPLASHHPIRANTRGWRSGVLTFDIHAKVAG